MKLKWRLNAAEFETLDAAHQAHYEPEGDGVYVAVVIDDDGLRVSPPPDASGLKSALAKQTEETRRLREELKAERAKNAPNKSQIKELETELAEREQQNVPPDAKRAAALEVLKQEWEPRLAEADGKLKVFNDGLDEHAIDSAVRKAIRAAHGVPELLTHHVRKRVKVEVDSEGARRVVIVDDDGNTRLDEHGQPVPVDQLVEEIKLFGDPVLLRAFDRDRNGNGN